MPRGLPAACLDAEALLAFSSMTNRRALAKRGVDVPVHRSSVEDVAVGVDHVVRGSSAIPPKAIGPRILAQMTPSAFNFASSSAPSRTPAENLCVVLAQQRRARHLGRRRREPDRAARGRHAPTRGMLDVDDHAAARRCSFASPRRSRGQRRTGRRSAEEGHHLVLVAVDVQPRRSPPVRRAASCARRGRPGAGR